MQREAKRQRQENRRWNKNATGIEITAGTEETETEG